MSLLYNYFEYTYLQSVASQICIHWENHIRLAPRSLCDRRMCYHNLSDQLQAHKQSVPLLCSENKRVSGKVLDWPFFDKINCHTKCCLQSYLRNRWAPISHLELVAQYLNIYLTCREIYISVYTYLDIYLSLEGKIGSWQSDSSDELSLEKGIYPSPAETRT